MTCRSCLHSIGRGSVLWCVLLDAPAERPCKAYCYEPGAAG